MCAGLCRFVGEFPMHAKGEALLGVDKKARD